MGRGCAGRIPTRRSAGEEESDFLTSRGGDGPPGAIGSDQITLLQSEQETRRSRILGIGGECDPADFHDRAGLCLKKRFKRHLKGMEGKDRGFATIGYPGVFRLAAGTGSLRGRVLVASILLRAARGLRGPD